MPLKDLLVSFDRTAAGYARLDLAFNLARASRAYLSGAYRQFGPFWAHCACRDDGPG